MLAPDLELAKMRAPTSTNHLTADTQTMLHTQTRQPVCPPRVPGTDLRALTPYVSMVPFFERMHVPV